MVSKGFNISKFPTEQPEAPAQGTSHAWAQKLQRSHVPLEISLGRTGSPKSKGFSTASTKKNHEVAVSRTFRLPSAFGFKCQASEWSKKSGRLPNISKKYVDDPSKSLLPLETWNEAKVERKSPQILQTMRIHTNWFTSVSLCSLWFYLGKPQHIKLQLENIRKPWLHHVSVMLS